MNLEQINIGMIITIVFAVFVLFGFLVGLIRGLKKTIIRTIFMVAILLLIIFLTTPITLGILRADLSAIPGLGAALDETTSIEKLLEVSLTQALDGMGIENMSAIINVALSIVAMLSSGIIFLLLFVVFKIISLPIYWIINLILVRKSSNKHRLFGGLVGCVLGIFIFVAFTTPIIGYMNIAKQVVSFIGTTEQISQSLNTISNSEDKTNYQIDDSLLNSELLDILEQIDKSPIISLLNSTGIISLQVTIFNEASTVTINNEQIKINDELENITKIYNNLTPFIDGSFDINNFEEITNDPEKLQGFSQAFGSLVDSLYESKLFKSTLTTVLPAISNMANETISEALKNSEGLNGELIDPIVAIIKEFTTKLSNSDSQDVKDAITSILSLIEILPKFENIQDATVEDFGKLGNFFDSIIKTGFISQQSITNLVNAVLDVASESITDESSQEFKDILAQLKSGFNSSNIVYKNEFMAIGEILTVAVSLTNGEDGISDVNPELIRSLGVALDKTFSHNSQIITRELLDNIVVSILNSIPQDEINFEGIDEIIEDIKLVFKNHEIQSFTNEFDVLADLFVELEKLTAEDTSNIDFAELGKAIDKITAKDSKLITKELISKAMVLAVDALTEELDTSEIDLTQPLNKIKEALKDPDISYEIEFTAIGKLVSVLEETDSGIENIDLVELGTTLDEIIALESKTLSKENVNDIINLLIDTVLDSSALDEDYNSAVTIIKNNLDNDDLVYATEFEAINTLLQTLTDLNNENLELWELGITLDEIIALNSQIITRDVINEFIITTIDSIVDFEGSDVDYTNVVNKVKNGFNNNTLNYTAEFSAMNKLIDCFDSLSLENSSYVDLGKTFDEIIALNSQIITRDIINETIITSIDTMIDTEDYEVDYSDVLNKIKQNFDNDTLVYEDEFNAIDKIISSIEDLQNSTIEIASLGVTLDEIVALNSKVITRNVINNMIILSLDSLTDFDNAGVDYSSSIQKIEQNFNNETLSYTTEFNALDKLVSSVNEISNNNFAMAEFGADIDEILSLEGKVITQEIINEVIVLSIDSFVEIDVEGVDYTNCINKIKNEFNEDITSYQIEFTAIDMLIASVDGISDNNFDMTEFGADIDEILSLEAEVITQEIINEVIVISIDSVIEIDVEGVDYTNCINDIKNEFDEDITSYQTEFTVIDMLVSSVDEISSPSFSMEDFGAVLDDVVASNSQVISRPIVNKMIIVSFDSFATIEMSSGANLNAPLTKIKNGFNNNYLEYEKEFSALNLLTNSFESMSFNNSSLYSFGETLDTIVERESQIITKPIINELLSSSFSDFVDEDDINNAGGLSSSIENIKTRLDAPTTIIDKYAVEFKAIDTLLDISTQAGALSINNINDKVFNGNTQTIGDILDADIKNSVLVGDCGLIQMQSVLDDFISANNGNGGSHDYSHITSQINKNFNAIKPTVKCAPNGNLNATNGFKTYTQVFVAFSEINVYLEDSSTKITGKLTFDVAIAEEYEKSLDKMQQNILLDKNGTRAVAEYLCDEIIEFLVNKMATLPPIVSNTVAGYMNNFVDYKNYLARPETLLNNNLDKEEIYYTTDTNYTKVYAYSTDHFVTNITFTEDKASCPSEGCVEIIRPFTTIAEQLVVYIH